MEKKIKVYYANIDNVGDKLNKYIIKKCFDYDIVRRTYLTGQLSSIGSGLDNYLYDKNILKNFLKFVSSIFFKSVYVWGTGFITDNKEKKFYKKNMKFYAVRGNLSKNKIEKIINKKLNIPVGDPGILASLLLDEIPEKKYDLGIIPHYKEQDEPIFKELSKKYNNSIIINLKDDPLEVVKKIAQCKIIISSSLHGLVIADSFLIPNIHIVVTNKLLGDGFKFNDYYSSYNLKHEFIDLNSDVVLKDIVRNYKITEEMVENKKSDLIRSFPKFRRGK